MPGTYYSAPCCCNVGEMITCGGIDLVCPSLLSMSLSGMTYSTANCSFAFSFSVFGLGLTAANEAEWLSTEGVPIPGTDCELHGSFSVSVTSGSCNSLSGGLCTGPGSCGPQCSGGLQFALVRCKPGPADIWEAKFTMSFPSINLIWERDIVGCPGGSGWSLVFSSFGGIPASNHGSFSVA